MVVKGVFYVPGAGIEPARQRHWILNPARLPVPPPGREFRSAKLRNDTTLPNHLFNSFLKY